MLHLLDKLNFLNHQKTKNLFFQLLILAITFFLFSSLFKNAQHNLQQQGIASGFDFLSQPAGFDIIMHLIDYNEQSSYFRALLVGLLNTLLLSIVSIVFASIVGFIIGVSRLSKNWLVAKLSLVYIEIFRNIPLLLQIFFWYFAVLRMLPPPKHSLVLFDMFFLNIRGLYLPNFFTMDYPVLQGFNFSGGIVIIPELLSLVIALSIYTAAFIAEIVRSGILSVPRGQTEAALALGLNDKLTLKLIIIPQALKVIIPLLTSQYLNLVKNSSLAAAIAYPDLVSVFAGTVLNQTGQAIEVIAITMSIYLFISLSISILMNWYNKNV